MRIQYYIIILNKACTIKIIIYRNHNFTSLLYQIRSRINTLNSPIIPKFRPKIKQFISNYFNQPKSKTPPNPLFCNSQPILK